MSGPGTSIQAVALFVAEQLEAGVLTHPAELAAILKEAVAASGDEGKLAALRDRLASYVRSVQTTAPAAATAEPAALLAAIPVELRAGDACLNFAVADVFDEADHAKLAAIIRAGSHDVAKIVVDFEDQGEDPDSDHWHSYVITTRLVLAGAGSEKERALPIGTFSCGMFGSLGRNGSWPGVTDFKEVLRYGSGWGGGGSHSLLD